MSTPIIGKAFIPIPKMQTYRTEIKKVSKVTPNSPDTFGVLLCAVVCIRLEDAVYKLLFGRSGRTGLVVVINKVIAATLSGIATIGRSPIIKYIISQVNQFRIGSTGVAATTKERQRCLGNILCKWQLF